MTLGPFTTLPGRRYPPGASLEPEGVNFSIFSRHATGVELLLYQGHDSPEPFQVIRLDPEINHTFFSWHLLVVGLPVGTHFTWRMEGPNDPRGRGLRFDARVELLEPCARAVNKAGWDRWRRLRQGFGNCPELVVHGAAQRLEDACRVARRTPALSRR